jgi:hypothetical protein
MEEYVDIRDFCEQLGEAAPELKGECGAVIDALKKVVIECRYSGADVQHSHGLSLFFPWCATDRQLHRYSRYYRISWKGKKMYVRKRETPFNKATGWGDFLWEFIYATRRKVPKGNGDLIFMPPQGYRDHLRDYHATAERDASFDINIIPPDGFRTNPPSARTNPPSAKMLMGGAIPFSKIKNPAMGFYEEQNERKSAEGNETK